VPERLTIEKFHRDELLAAVLADVVNGANVRVIQRRCGLRLTLETSEGLRVTGDGASSRSLVAAEWASSTRLKTRASIVLSHSNFYRMIEMVWPIIGGAKASSCRMLGLCPAEVKVLVSYSMRGTILASVVALKGPTVNVVVVGVSVRATT
jgi:hypothetical protein